MAGEEPKLIIDTDWKSQAQAEKERLAQQTAAAKPGAGAMPGEAGEGELPQEIGLQDVVGLLASQAMSYLGYYPDPQTGQAMVSIEYAKLHIDMLAVLETKTKGNLTPQEQEFLSKMLGRLRMDFVEVSKAVAKAVAEGRLKPGSPVGVGGGPALGVMPAGGPETMMPKG